MSRTRSLPAEKGCTGHQIPMVRTNASKVSWSWARTSTDCRTGGRRNGVTTARLPGSPVGVMVLSSVLARVAGRRVPGCFAFLVIACRLAHPGTGGPVQVVAEPAQGQRPQGGQ